MSKKYNIQRLKKIGGGCTCNAFKKNNRVIKTVSCDDDIKMYQYFSDKKTKHIVRIIDIYKDVVDNRKVDVVVSDLANTTLHKKFYNKLYYQCNGELRTILSNIHKTKSLVKYKNEDNEFNVFIDDLISLVTELHNHNMYCLDIHSGNIGYIGKRLVLFDLGCMSSFKYKILYKVSYFFNSFVDKFMNIGLLRIFILELFIRIFYLI